MREILIKEVTMIKVAINGTGRIGLCVARIIGARDDIEIVAINSTADIATLAHLLRFDSVHRHSVEIEVLSEDRLRIGNSKNIRILSDREPKNLDFGEAVCVIECTGKFNSAEKSSAHLQNNVKKVVISAPAENAPMFVYGVNHESYKGESVISNASCTTNCLAPVVAVLHSNFGVESGLMTTIHSYTNDQNVLDVKHKDIRRARAAALNMIPTSTGAAKAIGKILPELDGKLNGVAIRVPTPNVSLVDLSVRLKKSASVEAINEAFLEAERKNPQIIHNDTQKLVSSDFVDSTYSSIFVPDKTIVVDNFNAKVLAWYDNEVGYSARLVDLVAFVNA